MRDVTLVLPVRDGKILLGMKKRGFGEGKINGFGGKLNEGESIFDAAVRELSEEIGIVVEGLRKVGELDFRFPHKEDGSWDQRAHVFLAEGWEGEPKESEEMSCDWYDIIIETLQTCNIAQCCAFYEQEFGIGQSGVYTYLTTRQKQLVFCGGAWAFHRSVLVEMDGFFEKCIVGGGDTLLSCAAIDISLLKRTGFRNYKPHVFEALFEWSRKLSSFATFGCAGLSGLCLPHGTKEGRQYYNRHKLLADFELHHVHNGKWTESAPEELKENVANYIKSVN